MAKKHNEPETPTKESQTVVAVPVDGLNLPTFYVNHTSFDVTPMDVRVRLGQIQSRDGNNINVNEVAVFYMSLPQAHAFVDILGKTLLQLNQALQAANVQTEAK